MSHDPPPQTRSGGATPLHPSPAFHETRLGARHPFRGEGGGRRGLAGLACGGGDRARTDAAIARWLPRDPGGSLHPERGGRGERARAGDSLSLLPIAPPESRASSNVGYPIIVECRCCSKKA